MPALHSRWGNPRQGESENVDGNTHLALVSLVQSQRSCLASLRSCFFSSPWCTIQRVSCLAWLSPCVVCQNHLHTRLTEIGEKYIQEGRNFRKKKVNILKKPKILKQKTWITNTRLILALVCTPLPCSRLSWIESSQQECRVALAQFCLGQLSLETLAKCTQQSWMKWCTYHHNYRKVTAWSA